MIERSRKKKASGGWLKDAPLLGLSSFLVAFLSFIVATVSLNYSIEAQRTDNEFKELSIRPNLDIREDPSHLAVYVENSGLGPAIVKETRISFGSKCSESSLSGDESWRDRYNQIFSEYLDEIENLIPDAATLVPTRSAVIITPGKFIKPGESDIIYKMNIVGGETLEELEQKNGGDWYAKTNSAFATLEDRLSITFKFCSVSGSFCSYSGLNIKKFCNR